MPTALAADVRPPRAAATISFPQSKAPAETLGGGFLIVE